MKKIIASVLVVAGLLVGVGLFAPHMALADASAEVCKGASLSGSGCTDNGVSLSTIAKNIIQVFAIIIGIVGVIMIMVGGFKYITANGDSSSIASAKNTIIFALVGLVIAASAQTIVWFVLGKVVPK